MTETKSNQTKEAPTIKRYHSFTVALHWLMAIAFFWMLACGAAMRYLDLDKSLIFNLYQWHKSSGVLLLLAAFLRLSVSLVSKRPGLPPQFSDTDKVAAKAGHVFLYILMFVMPISGWVVVSSSVYGLPTIVFDMFEWPHIPKIQGNEAIHEIAEWIHFIGAITFGLMIAAHILAVVKHKIKDNENLLPRMWFTTGDK